VAERPWPYLELQANRLALCWCLPILLGKYAGEVSKMVRSGTVLPLSVGPVAIVSSFFKTAHGPRPSTSVTSQAAASPGHAYDHGIGGQRPGLRVGVGSQATVMANEPTVACTVTRIKSQYSLASDGCEISRYQYTNKHIASLLLFFILRPSLVEACHTLFTDTHPDQPQNPC
jgi:hypothetical protein